MLKPGDKINQRYAISRVISSGLLSNVYEAQDTAIQRRVVMKELVGGKNRPSTARIQREVALYARLRHSNILELLDVVIAEGTVYLIFPLIEGETLAALIRRGRIAMPTALVLARDLADAVAFVHGKNIIHRDLKPANILVDKGRVVLADFGIAKDTAEEEGLVLTREGETLGTPLYMAPEAIRNDAIGPPADIYALGVVFFEMFAGTPPFTGRTFAELVANQLKANPPSLAQVRPDIPQGLAELVSKMLGTDPAARPTAVQVRESLEALGATPSTESRDHAPMPGIMPALAPAPSWAPSLGEGSDPPLPPEPASAPPPPIVTKSSVPLWTPVMLSSTLNMELGKTMVVRGKAITDTLHEEPDGKGHGFFHDELARQNELKLSREFYRAQMSDDYKNLMFQAKVSFWLWVLFSFVGFVVFIIGIVLLYNGHWQEGSATMVSETIVVFIQKLFKDREDEFRERAAKKNRHVELGNLWNLAAQSLDGLDAATRREKLGKLTDALISQVGGVEG